MAQADLNVVPLEARHVSVSSVDPRESAYSTPITSTTAGQRWTWTLLIALLAFLLASFPARNPDLWLHLAKGRLLAHGHIAASTEFTSVEGLPPTQGWLVDVLAYGIYQTLGGTGLVIGKALLVAVLAFLVLRLSRSGQNWWSAVFCTSLALLAMGTRLLLQPATVSYLFLALTLWLLYHRSGEQVPEQQSSWADWPLAVLFLVWANADSWFVLGLGTVALVWLGQILDAVANRRPDVGAQTVRRLATLFVLALACLLNPAHLRAFVLPAELNWLPYWTYLTVLKPNPASLAYIPLLLLGCLSFAVNLPRWHWQRFLPWLGMALLSAGCARAIPFFAVVAGPVLAWNLHELEIHVRRRQTAGQQRLIVLGHVLTGALVVGLVVCAWPGWLQVPPYGPRAWAVETSPSLGSGAAAMRGWLDEGKLGPDARGLHLSPDTAYAFAWFCPEAKGVRDDQLASLLRGESQLPRDGAERLRRAGINHVIVYDADPDVFLASMARMLEEPREWPLLYVQGYLAVFGWRDPLLAGGQDRFRSLELDVDGLAFRPPEEKRAPADPSSEAPEPREWYEAFWKPSLPRSLDQDEATLYSMYAEIVRRSAPERHLIAWEATQSAAMIAAAGGWTGATSLVDARLRLTLVRPQTPALGARPNTLPGLDQLAWGMQSQFARQRDDTPPALLYMAVRAARRALVSNPDAAQAYLVLGECYTRLLHSTRERDWGQQINEVTQLRQVQAIAALNHAVTLRPDYAQAQLSLYQLYGEMGYLDLAMEHLGAYRELTRRAARAVDPDSELSLALQMQDEQYDRFSDQLKRRRDLYEVAAAGKTGLDKAFLAMKYGLAARARDVLLESNIAAFGDKGLILELELLLRTGQPELIADWTSPEHRPILGPLTYHWFRAEAFAALGNYKRAQEEFDQLFDELMVGPQGRPIAYRDTMTALICRRVLDEYSLGRSLPDLVNLAFSRTDFLRRIGGMAQSLKREADVIVLRGLLALEEGAVDEAEKAFREALTYWKDQNAAATGGGLDFNGRTLAQACLGWLQQLP